MDYAREEGRKIGLAAAKKAELEITKKLKISGMSFDKISDITNLTIEEIEKI